jgi:hypothetical protein
MKKTFFNFLLKQGIFAGSKYKVSKNPIRFHEIHEKFRKELHKVRNLYNIEDGSIVSGEFHKKKIDVVEVVEFVPGSRLRDGQNGKPKRTCTHKEVKRWLEEFQNRAA